MRLLLASRLCAHRGGFPSAATTSQWQRSSIHFWHYINQTSPHGQTKFLGYEEATMPDLGEKKIRLFSGSTYVGLVPVQAVLDDWLRPGMMLSLRDNPSEVVNRTSPEDYHYEVRKLRTIGQVKSKRMKTKGFRAKELYLNAKISPSRLKHVLETAYKFLDPERRVDINPVEFHVKLQKSEHRSSTELSLFTGDRVDLHPAVIMRALPEGVFLLVKPQASSKGADAVWVVASRTFLVEQTLNDRSEARQAERVEELITAKKELLEELIEVGDLTTSGRIVGTRVYRRKDEKKLRERKKRMKPEESPLQMSNKEDEEPLLASPRTGRLGP